MIAPPYFTEFAMRVTFRTSTSLLFSSLIAGCISTSDIYLADGSVGHVVSCNSRVNSIEDCFTKAGEICGNQGYETVNAEGLSTGRSIAKGSTDINSGGLVTRNIMVRCKEAAQEVPVR